MAQQLATLSDQLQANARSDSSVAVQTMVSHVGQLTDLINAMPKPESTAGDEAIIKQLNELNQQIQATLKQGAGMATTETLSAQLAQFSQQVEGKVQEATTGAVHTLEQQLKKLTEQVQASSKHAAAAADKAAAAQIKQISEQAQAGTQACVTAAQQALGSQITQLSSELQAALKQRSSDAHAPIAAPSLSKQDVQACIAQELSAFLPRLVSANVAAAPSQPSLDSDAKIAADDRAGSLTSGAPPLTKKQKAAADRAAKSGSVPAVTTDSSALSPAPTVDLVPVMDSLQRLSGEIQQLREASNRTPKNQSDAGTLAQLQQLLKDKVCSCSLLQQPFDLPVHARLLTALCLRYRRCNCQHC